jgi:hypothetical protein
MLPDLVKKFAFNMKQGAASGAFKMIMVAATLGTTDILITGAFPLFNNVFSDLSDFNQLIKVTVDRRLADCIPLVKQSVCNFVGSHVPVSVFL